MTATAARIRRQIFVAARSRLAGGAAGGDPHPAAASGGRQRQHSDVIGAVRPALLSVRARHALHYQVGQHGAHVGNMGHNTWVNMGHTRGSTWGTTRGSTCDGLAPVAMFGKWLRCLRFTLC